MNSYQPGPYNHGAPQWQPPPAPVRQKSSVLVPVIILLTVVLVVLVGLVAWMFVSRGGQTGPAVADTSVVVDVTETPSPRTGNTTIVETVTETRQQGSGGFTNSAGGSSSGGYGAGLQVRERCWNGTSASAIFRGDGTAKCNFIALVGDRLSGSPASGYRSLSVTSPNTGERISLSCQRVQDSNLTQLWRCDTHHGSRLYVYP